MGRHEGAYAALRPDRRVDVTGSRTALAQDAGRIAAGTTIESVADYLGVEVYVSRPALADSGGRRLYDPVTADERRKHGYGDLPDELIRTVKGHVSPMVPDYGNSTDLFWAAAARTMELVRSIRDISPEDLRTRITDTRPDHPLVKELDRSMPPSALGLIDSVVTTTHFVTQQYYDELQRKGEQ
jgi:hypothetical protein